jgi:NAD kinase
MPSTVYDKIVLVTQKTALEELLERFNTREQARFYLEHLGASFEGYLSAHETYVAALAALQRQLPGDVRRQTIERSFLPNFLFGGRDLVVVLGRDGLVVNTAKYLTDQLLVGFNPDPERIDGVLLPFTVDGAEAVLPRALREECSVERITMAKAALNTGQNLYAVNDLFIGQKTHVSARYHIRYREREEHQSSSGLIVSTGAGSTGWLRSILTGAAGVVHSFVGGQKVETVKERYRFGREERRLMFSVREPFISRSSGAEIVFGRIEEEESLAITSQMPLGGVIFSDGIEQDYLEFSSGVVAQIGVAEKRVNLVVDANPASGR